MDHLTARFELKELDGESGVFSGHAAVFGNRDLGGDVIEPGAFSKTLKDSGGKRFILVNHDMGHRAGVAYLSEDGKGLRIDRGVLNLDTTAGRELHAEMKFYQSHEMALGLSIGYEAVKRDYVGDTRHLRELKLHEVSVVSLGMNPKAKVTNVKEAEDVAELRARIATLEETLATLQKSAEQAPAAVADTTPEPPESRHSEVDVPASFRSALAELSAYVRSKE